MTNTRSQVSGWFLDTVWGVAATTSLVVVLLVSGYIGALAGGTALWRSHNTDPRIGTVWTGGIFSDVSEKCYGVNLIINDGNGLATINNAVECKR